MEYINKPMISPIKNGKAGLRLVKKGVAYEPENSTIKCREPQTTNKARTEATRTNFVKSFCANESSKKAKITETPIKILIAVIN